MSRAHISQICYFFRGGMHGLFPLPLAHYLLHGYLDYRSGSRLCSCRSA